MKRNNIEIRSYTRQFYKHNILCLLIALCGTLLITIAALLVSWLLQQLLDLIGGYDTGITLSELIMMTLALIGIIVMRNSSVTIPYQNLLHGEVHNIKSIFFRN